MSNTTDTGRDNAATATEPPTTSDTPISGHVHDFDFVDDGRLLVEVEDGEGTLWYETYEFVTAERANDRRDQTMAQVVNDDAGTKP